MSPSQLWRKERGSGRGQVVRTLLERPMEGMAQFGCRGRKVPVPADQRIGRGPLMTSLLREGEGTSSLKKWSVVSGILPKKAFEKE